MARNKDSKHKLLIQKIKKISVLLNSTNPNEEEVFDAVIDFILLSEHVVKKILYRKNKLLIYNLNLNNASDLDTITNIIKEKNTDAFKIRLSDALVRYRKIFPKSKLNKHGASMEILIYNRNELDHGIGINIMQTKEELLGALNNVFPIFLEISKSILGSVTLPITNIKIKKEVVYTEKDIQEIYENNVLSKIKNYTKNPFYISVYDPVKYSTDLLLIDNEYCPRCSKRSLSKKSNSFSFLAYRSVLQDKNPDLYVCSNCNLELTDLEYEVVQKLKKEGKIKIDDFFI